ncbi:histone-lysine N-methyltransferase SETMAR-like [Polypterus senegalus]|uniref:histone-lysine N-methyltransferase SETMAR-like n=1 Tax=Polypterus senegalus TaxID=55291 RepID=UPI0019623160|nr:histone-lysine N-methyltransferase SETMAR-like [Polypterus senegalus]
MELPLNATAKCEVCAVIRFLNAKGVKPVEIHRQLTEVYGQSCMDVKNVRKWCREFTAGRTEIHNEQRSGRPSISDETVTKVEENMCEDRRITLDALCILAPEVSRSTIHRILTEKLQYRKVCARWVPRMLIEHHKWQRVDSSCEFLCHYANEKDNFLDSIVTGDKTWVFHFTPETKQQSREWRHSSSSKLRKFKQIQSAGKVMATVFWDRKGVLLVDFKPAGTTINADTYCETLKKLSRAIQNQRRGMLSKGILHVNPRPHVTRQTVALLQNFGWNFITHPPYILDLAPSDYHLFPKLKEQLSGRQFFSDEEVKDEVQHFLKDMPQRLQKCIDRNGDYVEK